MNEGQMWGRVKEIATSLMLTGLAACGAAGPRQTTQESGASFTPEATAAEVGESQSELRITPTPGATQAEGSATPEGTDIMREIARLTDYIARNYPGQFK